jgi:hypothetical protein
LELECRALDARRCHQMTDRGIAAIRFSRCGLSLHGSHGGSTRGGKVMGIIGAKKINPFGRLGGEVKKRVVEINSLPEMSEADLDATIGGFAVAELGSDVKIAFGRTRSCSVVIPGNRRR